MYSSEARYGAIQFEAPEKLKVEPCNYDGCHSFVDMNDGRKHYVKDLGVCCVTHFLMFEKEAV